MSTIAFKKEGRTEWRDALRPDEIHTKTEYDWDTSTLPEGKYRVRIEASSSLAKQMRESGDYDAALRYASDALAIACRYGHSLHKISLRVEIGRILVERGDPISGDALLQSALEAAMLSGYHRTVERVQRARQVERPPPPAG